MSFARFREDPQGPRRIKRVKEKSEGKNDATVTKPDELAAQSHTDSQLIWVEGRAGGRAGEARRRLGRGARRRRGSRRERERKQAPDGVRLRKGRKGAGGGLGEREIKEEISESQRDNGRLGGLLGFNEGCSRGAGGAGTSACARRRGRFGLGET